MIQLFERLVARSLVIRGNATLQGVLTALAGIVGNVTGDVTGNAIIGLQRFTKQATITVENAVAFAPTGTYQPITAAGAVSPTITMGAAGDLLILVNVGANAITIADTGTTMLSANAILGQHDSLTLLCDGTNWIELARSNN